MKHSSQKNKNKYLWKKFFWVWKTNYCYIQVTVIPFFPPFPFSLAPLLPFLPVRPFIFKTNTSSSSSPSPFPFLFFSLFRNAIHIFGKRRGEEEGERGERRRYRSRRPPCPSSMAATMQAAYEEESSIRKPYGAPATKRATKTIAIECN